MIESSRAEHVEEAHGHHIHEVNEQDRLYVDDDDDDDENNNDESFGQVDLTTPPAPRLPTTDNASSPPLFGSITSPFAKLSFTG